MNSFKKPSPSQFDYENYLKKDIFYSLFCHAIAKVESVDLSNQTISAKIQYKKIIYKRNNSEEYVKRLEPYPVLLDVPFIVLHGGNSGLMIPPKVGDDCLILFNDRSIDEWFKSGQDVVLNSPRAHSISDGIALIGLRSEANSFQDFEQFPTLFHESTKVRVAEKVKIENQSQNLNNVLQDLIEKLNELSTQIASLTVTGVTSGSAASGVPANAAQFTSIASDLSQIGSRLGEILE